MNYLIVDDEPQARKLLKAYMDQIGGYELKGLCSSAVEAYTALQEEKIDFMLLDIKMPVISGTDFLRSLKSPPLVIFTTAYTSYALEGYELNAVDYLLKPISLQRLMQALEKVRTRYQLANKPVEQVPEFVFLKIDGRLIKVNFTDILLIEGMQNYIKIHLLQKSIIAPYTMKAMEDILPTGMFLRVHRSFIVPVKNVISVQGNVVETTYRVVPIGVTYKDDVLKTITAY